MSIIAFAINDVMVIVLYTQGTGVRSSAQKTPVLPEIFVVFLVPPYRYSINALENTWTFHTVLIYLLDYPIICSYIKSN